MAVALATLLHVAASAGAAPPAAPVHRGFTRGEPLLWRVERARAVSYLFGTCHLPLDLEKTLQPAGLAALDHATRVFLEMDVSSPMTVLDFMQIAGTRAQMPDRSLRALLTPPLWEQLVALHHGHVDADTLDHLKPWSAAFITYTRLAEKRRTTMRPHPELVPRAPILDVAVALRAKGHGIRVEGLESPLEHMQVFNAQRLQDGIRMLTDVLVKPEASDEAPRVLDACLIFDERVIAKEAGRLERRFPALGDRLLADRNRAWITRLDQWLPDGNMFVAVGAGHMYGPEGLVAGLRRRGYRVSRMTASAP